MNAEIISIGTELLLGRITDTNARFLSHQLSGFGIDVFYRQTVGDNKFRLKAALKIASLRADLIITIGGLGPTVDDITLKTVSELLGLKLIKSNYILNRIKKYFSSRGLVIPSSISSYCVTPHKGIIFKNDYGTAPGVFLKFKKKSFLLLPGPPYELIPMFKKYVYGYLKKRFPSKFKIISKTIKLAGIPESAVNVEVKDLLSLKGPVTVGIYTLPDEVHLVITAKAQSDKKILDLINGVKRKIYSRLKGYIFGEDNDLLEAEAGKLLLKKEKTVALAESATGGLVSSRITDIAGSSRYFLGSIIAYSNTSKINTLTVKKTTISKYGAVSKNCAEEMAKNIKKILKSDIGLAITGIAGPSGLQPGKPIGTHYISLYDGKKIISERFLFTGQRETIKYKASQAALVMLWNYLK